MISIARISAVAVASLCLLTSGALAENVKIGVVEGLSGAPAIVDFGESYLQGVKMAVKEYQARGGKHKIELIVYDDEANPQRSVSLVQRLISNDNVSVVIGTVNSGNVMAFAPILQQAKVPLVAGPSIATDITTKFINEKPSYIFRCSMVEQNQIDAILDYATRKYKRIGLIHSTTGYAIFAAKGIQEGMQKRGIKLVAIEAAAPTVTDLTPQLLKLKEAGAEVALNFHESFELMFRAMGKLDYHPVVMGNWGLSSLKVAEVVGMQNIEGTLMGQALDLADPKAKAFNNKMGAEYGKEYRWPVIAALGYDAGNLVLNAIDRAGSGRDAIRNALETTTGFKAVSGTPATPYSPTDHECLDAKDVFLGIWRGGDVVRAN